jgi:hypothetical protein
MVAGLQAYLNHPVHDRLAASFFAGFEHALMYDFELGDGEGMISALVDEERE